MVTLTAAVASAGTLVSVPLSWTGPAASAADKALSAVTAATVTPVADTSGAVASTVTAPSAPAGLVFPAASIWRTSIAPAA